ncbi:hypothetical protein [Flavobacterium phycosphaerae]|uniref:hypothetical protein n=1 Tax=Flavobacterium phycosphaerae TaxID=2697515 RepID=UPI00138A3C5B|nr:hypothetical protein [Flavobacterium phycosphaerae]
MKNLYSCLLILTFFASCTNEENSQQETSSAILMKGSGTLPSNNANPHDNAGRIYDAIFDAYYDGSNRPKDAASVITQVETLANANTSFVSLDAIGSPLEPERIQYLAEKRSVDIGAIIGASNLSPIAKTSFSNFLITMVTLYEAEMDAAKIANAVIKYEETVIGNTLFSEKDERVILTSTSILRFSAYRAKKKPKKNTDPDWLIWVTHVYGAEEGAEENEAKAIVAALVTGIVSNK